MPRPSNWSVYLKGSSKELIYFTEIWSLVVGDKHKQQEEGEWGNMTHNRYSFVSFHRRKFHGYFSKNNLLCATHLNDQLLSLCSKTFGETIFLSDHASVRHKISGMLADTMLVRLSRFWKLIGPLQLSTSIFFCRKGSFSLLLAIKE